MLQIDDEAAFDGMAMPYEFSCALEFLTLTLPYSQDSKFIAYKQLAK